MVLPIIIRQHIENVGVYLYAWENRVAFVPWTIAPYWSIDLFFGLVLFVCTDKRELNILALRLLFCILICVTGFLLFPLQVFDSDLIYKNMFDF